jgi:peptide deformylase
MTSLATVALMMSRVAAFVPPHQRVATAVLVATPLSNHHRHQSLSPPFTTAVRGTTRSTSSSSNSSFSWTSFLRSSIPTSTSSSFLKMSVQEEVDPGAVEGTSLRIVKYPHPALRAKNVEIDVAQLLIKDSPVSLATAQLAKEMFLLMYAAEGVGLAAPQVGVNQRLMVFNAAGGGGGGGGGGDSSNSNKWLNTDETVLINPQIVATSETTDTDVEGCLSFPDMQGDVTRYKWIKVEGYTLKGRKIKKKYQGWEARIFQHEYDHLDGIVYVDRLNEEHRGIVQPKLNALVQDFGEGGAV